MYVGTCRKLSQQNIYQSQSESQSDMMTTKREGLAWERDVGKIIRSFQLSSTTIPTPHDKLMMIALSFLLRLFRFVLVKMVNGILLIVVYIVVKIFWGHSRQGIFL